jgi:hypothetical protein
MEEFYARALVRARKRGIISWSALSDPERETIEGIVITKLQRITCKAGATILDP